MAIPGSWPSPGVLGESLWIASGALRWEVPSWCSALGLGWVTERRWDTMLPSLWQPSLLTDGGRHWCLLCSTPLFSLKLVSSNFSRRTGSQGHDWHMRDTISSGWPQAAAMLTLRSVNKSQRSLGGRNAGSLLHCEATRGETLGLLFFTGTLIHFMFEMECLLCASQRLRVETLVWVKKLSLRLTSWVNSGELFNLTAPQFSDL